MTTNTKGRPHVVYVRDMATVWALKDLARLIEQQTGQKCFMADATGVAIAEALKARTEAPKVGPDQDAPTPV